MVTQSLPIDVPMPRFQWTARREEAAMLVAMDELTNAAICARVGISPATLARWKNSPQFASRVEEHLGSCRAEVRVRGIAQLERRVQALDDRWNRMRRLIEERAADRELAGVPGGTTGLIVKRTKAAGSGETFQLIDEYVVDAALLRELREHEKQAAQELGQWVETRTVEQVTKAYVILGPEDL
jgi:cytochrome P450